MENSYNLGVYQIIDIYLILHNAYIVFNAQDKFV